MIWPRAILLDFYGTMVVEDWPVIYEVSAEIAAAATVPTTPKAIEDLWVAAFRDGITQCHGATFIDHLAVETRALRRVLEAVQAPLDADALAQRMLAFWRRPPLYPETREVLARCPVPICIVSNIDTAPLVEALAWHGLTVDCLVTSEDVRAYKPHPEPFQRALGLLGLPPEEVVHVGDSLTNDVHAAQALGIPALWINRFNAPLPTGGAPAFVAPDLTGLTRIILAGKVAAEV